MIIISYAMEGEIGDLKWFSASSEIRTERWEKGRRAPRDNGVIRKGTYRDKSIILVQTGIRIDSPESGNVQAREVMDFVLENFPVRMVVVAASGGGLKENLRKGDLVICNPICFPNQPPLSADSHLCATARTVLKAEERRFHEGMNLTIPFFAWQLEAKMRLATENPEAVIVEMEDYFIASATAAKRVPFLVVRAVADTLRPYESTDTIDKEIREMGTILRDDFLLPFLQSV